MKQAIKKIKQILFPVRYNLFFAINFAYMILLPDFVLELTMPSFNVNTDFVFVFVMFAFGFFLSLNRSFIGFLCITLLLTFLIGVQVSHIAYFGIPISPSEVGKIFNEFSDVATSSIANITRLWFVPVAIFIPIGLIIWLYKKLTHKMAKMPFALILVLCFFVPKIERSFRKEIKHFLPSPVRYVIHNSINTFSFYIAKEAWNNDKTNVPENFYKPYSVIKKSSLADNIIIVIGESIAPRRMSLYGADRTTTPFLDSLVNKDNFYSNIALSSGVSTHTGLAFFMNNINEPGNMAEFKTKTTNLFKLAKDQGYKTIFLSSQDAKNAYDIGTNYIDAIITVESERIQFAEKGDFALLDILEKTKLAEKNFIILQTRTAHDPYNSNYEIGGEYDVFKYGNNITSTYDNALLSFDGFMKKLFNSSIGKDSLIIATSDHGQAFGEKGFWGHNTLDTSIAEVPFFYYNQKGKAIYKPMLPSHYEIGKWIGELLGYEIINPNFKNSYYIHGNNFLSNYQFIEYKTKNGKLSTETRKFLSDFIKE